MKRQFKFESGKLTEVLSDDRKNNNTKPKFKKLLKSLYEVLSNKNYKNNYHCEQELSYKKGQFR